MLRLALPVLLLEDPEGQSRLLHHLHPCSFPGL